MDAATAIMGVIDLIFQIVFLGVGLWVGVVKEDWPRGTFWVAMSIVARL